VERLCKIVNLGKYGRSAGRDLKLCGRLEEAFADSVIYCNVKNEIMSEIVNTSGAVITA